MPRFVPARETSGRRTRSRLLWLALSLLGSAPASAGSATVHWHADTSPQAVVAEGIPADVLAPLEKLAPDAPEWEQVFVVFAEPGRGAITKTSLPAMAGKWRVSAGSVRFEPQFPFVHGVRYRTELRLATAPPIVSHFELPAAKPGRATEVVEVYPTADTLPENQLKFYVQFSAPMSRGGTHGHVHVRDAEGRVIDLPFLDLDEELWDPSMTRLTLLIDPGRIKRGVKPLEDIGPVFESGRSYSLTLEAACRDAAGQPLRATYAKKFRVTEADRTAPDPQRWKITPPRAGTRDAVMVEFDEPMDHALALRLVSIAQAEADGPGVAGDANLSRQEKTWSLIPVLPWGRGHYLLKVATNIEDLAGNNIGKTFDVDLAGGAPRRLASKTVSIPFEIK